MAEVGVLELTIKDNSAKATGGLKELAGALDTVRQSAGNNLGLAAVNTQLKDFATTVKRQKNTSAVIKNITEFGKAVAKLSTIKNAINFDVQPIADLKKAIGDGIKITGNPAGQLAKIREAISGEWGSESAIKAIRDLKNVAEEFEKSGAAATFSAVAKAIKEFKEAAPGAGEAGAAGMEQVNSTLQEGTKEAEENIANFGEIVRKYRNVTNNLEETINRPVKSGKMLRLNIQQFAEKSASGGNWRDQMAGVQQINEQVKSIDDSIVSKVQDITGALKELSKVSGGENLNAFASGLVAIADAAGKNTDTHRILGLVADGLTQLKGAMDGLSVPSFQRLIALADSLQANYYSADGLKKMAEGIEAVKQAGNGFTMPNVKGMEKVMAVMRGGSALNVGVSNSGTAIAADDASDATVQLEAFTSTLEHAGEIISTMPVSDMNTALQETGNTLESVVVTGLDDTTRSLEEMGEVASSAGKMLSTYVDSWKPNWTYADPAVFDAYIEKLNEMYRIWSTFVNEWHMFQHEGSRLAAGNAIPLLGDGAVPGQALLTDGAENFLSTWVDTGEQWKQNWVDYSSEAAQAMRDAWQPDWTPVEEGIDKAKLVEEALRRVSAMKEELLYKAENGLISKEEALKAAAEIEELEKKIPIVQQTIENATNEAAGNIQRSAEEVAASIQRNAEAAAAGLKYRILHIRKDFDGASDEIKRGVAEMYGLSVEQIWGSDSAAGLEQVGQTAEITAEQLAVLEAQAKGDAQLFDNYGNVDALVNGMSYAKAQVTSNVLAMQQQIEALIEKEEEMKWALSADIAAGLQDSQQIAGRIAAIRMLTEAKDQAVQKLKEYTQEQTLASKVGARLRSAFGDLKKGIHSMFPGLTRLAKQFQSIARRMMIRAIIKQVTSAFKEGVENVYQYSNAIGTDFAGKMDSAASSLQQMRNSIGAAVAPAIQALIPILQTVVSWVITAMNYINQFFALLSGQTQWTRALETATTAYEKSAKKAGGAASDWLADFDELNVMSSGGGGGATAGLTDFSKMFEQVSEFDSKVKDVINWIQKHMKTVRGIAEAIGLAILGWKLSRAFEGVVGTLGSILLGGAIATIGLQLTFEGAFDAGYKGGFNTENLIATIGGVLLDTIGMALIGYKLGGTWGMIIGGAAGLSIGIAVAYYAYKRGTANAAAKMAFAQAGEGGIDPGEYLKALQSEFDKRTAGAKLILDAYVDVPGLKQKLEGAADEIALFNQKIFNGDGKLSEEDAKAFKENWKMVMETLDQMETKTYNTLLSGVISAIGSDNEQLRTKAEETRVLMISLRDNVSEAKAAWIKETEDLADKIAAGTAEEKEVAEYKRRLSLIAAEDNGTTYTEAVEAAAENADRINFGDKDTALENATNFLTELKASSEESLGLIQDARDATEKAYKTEKVFLDDLYKTGKLNETEYNGQIEVLNAEYEVNIDFLTESENKIKEKVEEAYSKVFSQVAEAYKSLDSNDKKKEYWNSIVEPLIEAARKDGYGIPKELMDASPDRVLASSMETMVKENASNVEKLVYEAANAVTNFLFGDDMVDTAIGMMRDGSIFNAINFLGWHRLFGNSEEERPLESTEDTKKYMAKYGMQDTLQALVNQYMAEHNVSQLSGMENSSKMFAYLFSSLEQTSTQGGVESLKESDISDIVNSLLLILPEYESGLLLNWLDEQREAFGDTFDFEKVVKLIDWKALSNRTGEEYDAEEFAKEVNSWIDTYNSKNTNGMQIEHITPDQLFVNPNGAGGTGGEADTEAAVESGVKKGFSGQMDNTDRILRDILTTVRLKQFVITPNTAMGRAASASMGMYGNVTGDDPYYIP